MLSDEIQSFELPACILGSAHFGIRLSASSRAYMPCTMQKCVFCRCMIVISYLIAACVCPMHVLHIVSALLNACDQKLVHDVSLWCHADHQCAHVLVELGSHSLKASQRSRRLPSLRCAGSMSLSGTCARSRSTSWEILRRSSPSMLCLQASQRMAWLTSRAQTSRPALHYR